MTARTSTETATTDAGRTARAALDDLLLVSALLEADQARFNAEHGMTGPRVHLLWLLGLHGPSTQRELATALRVTPRNVTGLVDGLVGQGHVRREPHPTDRRATLVTLTAPGRRFVDELQRSHAELAEQVFGDVGRRELETFSAVLRRTAERIAHLVEEAAR